MSYLQTQYNVSEEEAKEAFCRGVHATHDAIHSGRFAAELHEHSLVKYLHQCCKRQLLKMFDEQSITVDSGDIQSANDWESLEAGEPATTKTKVKISSFSDGPEPADSPTETTAQREADLTLMKTILDDLPHPCKDLIWGKFYEGFSATDMAMRLGYNGPRVAITTLSRCMAKLKKRFNKERRLTDE